MYLLATCIKNIYDPLEVKIKKLKRTSQIKKNGQETICYFYILLALAGVMRESGYVYSICSNVCVCIVLMARACDLARGCVYVRVCGTHGSGV